MTDHFPDDQARAEYEQWHDEQDALSGPELMASLIRNIRPRVEPTPAQIAATYKKLAETALQAMVVREAADADPKNLDKRGMLEMAHVRMAEAFAEIIEAYVPNIDWLDTMREDAGMIYDDFNGEWLDPEDYRNQQAEGRAYAEMTDSMWRNR